MKHKNLNKIGVCADDPCVFLTTAKSHSRRRRLFDKQRKKHGFDERELWRFDFTLATWLYEHLTVFKKYAGKEVKLDSVVFDIPVLKENNILRCREQVIETHNLSECIDILINYLAEYIRKDCKASFDLERIGKREARAQEAYKCALEILSVIFPGLWY